MGEAKRRREYERAHAEENAAILDLQRERGLLIEDIASYDPEDLDPKIVERFHEINELLRKE